MMFVGIRACVLMLAAVLSLAGAASAATRELETDRGVVQRVSPERLVLRELDGSLVTITIGPRTRVRVNGLPSTIAVIRPGFVATAVHDGNAPPSRSGPSAASSRSSTAAPSSPSPTAD